MEYITGEQAALIASDRLARTEPKVYIISASKAPIKALIKQTGLPERLFTWLQDPKDLKGIRQPLVIIFPNWWRRNYSGMEQALIEAEAEIYTVNNGPWRPRFRQPRLGD